MTPWTLEEWFQFDVDKAGLEHLLSDSDLPFNGSWHNRQPQFSRELAFEERISLQEMAEAAGPIAMEELIKTVDGTPETEVQAEPSPSKARRKKK